MAQPMQQSALAHLETAALTPQEVDDILQRVFPSLPPDEVIQLWPYFSVYCARQDSAVFRQGEIGDYMLFTVDGMIKVMGDTDAAEPEVLALIGRGETLGEMGVVDDAPRSATCIALHDTVFAVLTSGELRRLSNEQPRLALVVYGHIARTLSARLRRASEALQQPADLFENYT
jgi:CRP/FNR family transcriptional regulator, cyclic AMP receptor protein